MPSQSRTIWSKDASQGPQLLKSVATSQRVATHRFIFFAEDWHGHSGEKHQALCLRSEELSGRRAKDRELRVHRVEDPQSPMSTITEVSPSKRRKKPQVRFPFSTKGELAEMLVERGGLGRGPGQCHLAMTVLSQGKCQNPRTHNAAPKHACKVLLSWPCQG